MENLKSRNKNKRNGSPGAGMKTSRKFSIVQKFLLLALVVQLCAAGVRAQLSPGNWNNFGDGSDPNTPVLTSTLYVDDTKAKATSMTGGPSIYTITLDLSSWAINATSSTTTFTQPTNAPNLLFAASDRIMLIDMGVTTTAQNYDFGTVQSYTYSSGIGTLVVQTPYYNSASSAWHLSTLSSKAQVIKVHQYNNVTIEHDGEITCDAWNGHIGGVVMFDATGTLTFTWSWSGALPQINATGLGGPGGTGGARGALVNHVAGGYGAGGAAMGGNGGDASLGGLSGDGLLPQYGDAMYDCSGTRVTGGNGGAGEFFYGSTPNGTFTHFLPSIFNTSTPLFALFIGNGGGGGSGGSGPVCGGWGGGGGGGYTGGSDGAHGGPTDPTIGGYGGKGGDGAPGGGIIYVRAWNISVTGSLSATMKIILADGSDASLVTGNGEAGSGSGGNGSAGGNGGPGNNNCTNPFPAGAGGRGGAAGAGACGGGGGAGGDGGTIWVVSGSSGSTTLVSTNCELNGGAHGLGGGGTFPGGYGTNGADGSYGTSQPNFCPPCSCGAHYDIVTDNENIACDCDDAFAILGNMNLLTTNTYTNSLYPNETVIRYSSPSNYFDAIETTTVASSCTSPTYNHVKTYECPMDPFNAYFTTYFTANYPATTTGTYTQWGTNGVDGYYKKGSNTLYADNTIATIVSQATTCIASNGNAGGGGGGVAGFGGEDGQDGNTKTLTTTTDGQNPGLGGYVFGPETVNNFDSRETNHLISIFPNPATGDVTLQFYSEKGGTSHGSIIDMQGKRFLDFDLNAVQGNQSLNTDISFLAKGTYLFCIQHDNRLEKVEFVRQ